MIYFLIKLSKILIAEKLEPGHISYCTEKNNSKKNNNDYLFASTLIRMTSNCSDPLTILISIMPISSSSNSCTHTRHCGISIFEVFVVIVLIVYLFFIQYLTYLVLEKKRLKKVNNVCKCLETLSKWSKQVITNLKYILKWKRFKSRNFNFIQKCWGLCFFKNLIELLSIHKVYMRTWW